MSCTCEHIEARLSDFVDGRLTPAEQMDFASHLQVCTHCASLASSVAGLVSRLQKLQPVAEPARLVHNILEKTLGPRERPTGWRAILEGLNFFSTPRFAYGALSIGATFAILLTAAGMNWKNPRIADLAPVKMYRSADRQAHLLYARGTKFVDDLRIVHEIQTRLRPEGGLPAAPEIAVPESAPQKQPGVTDGDPAATPRQQNRSNGMHPRMTIVAAGFADFLSRSAP